jgi:hypothetical protein
MTDDKAGILAAVQTYLDGLHEGDADKLAEVFHQTSFLTWEDRGALIPWTRDRWLAAVRKRPSAKARGLARHDEILMIDQATETMAFVKLSCAIPPNFYTDYLSLLKVRGRWRIAQKVFATDVRE